MIAQVDVEHWHDTERDRRNAYITVGGVRRYRIEEQFKRSYAMIRVLTDHGPEFHLSPSDFETTIDKLVDYHEGRPTNGWMDLMIAR